MKIIWYPAVSLDGYIADANGSADWITQEDDHHRAELIKSTGALIVGRRAFQQYHQPVNPFPQARTYVITRNPALLSEDPAISYVTGGPLELMRRLHDDGRLVAVLLGGAQANAMFAAANLIDEAWMSIYPQLLGSGTPALGSYQGAVRLSLKDGFRLPGGIVHNRYSIGTQ